MKWIDKTEDWNEICSKAAETTIDMCNVTIKACCDCEFQMRQQFNSYRHFGDSREFELKVWNSKICDLHKKEMKEKLLSYMESRIK